MYKIFKNKKITGMIVARLSLFLGPILQRFLNTQIIGGGKPPVLVPTRAKLFPAAHSQAVVAGFVISNSNA